MAISCLPTFPLFIFGILEPALLVYAYYVAMADPYAFYAAQTPTHNLGASSITTFPPQAQIFTYQLVNVYLLLAGLALTCSFTRHASVAKLYLFFVALADYGHILSCYLVIPTNVLLDVSQWNDMIWGSVGGSIFLNVVRLGTLLGLFGAVRDVKKVGAGKKGN
ncbi:hypothetical protein F5Y16DRAFT_363294 [Xylariaceae sp. FL0255]|nr:hypothetical protein F5Y16DRAFT_363294 [Xylariaceae sp. FL0255]